MERSTSSERSLSKKYCSGLTAVSLVSRTTHFSLVTSRAAPSPPGASLPRHRAGGAFGGRALLHPAPVAVDEGVGEDLEEPRLHVGAALELVEEAERAQEGVLHQILGVPLVLRQPEGRRIELVEVLQRQGLELPARPVGVLEVEHPGTVSRG